MPNHDVIEDRTQRLLAYLDTYDKYNLISIRFVNKLVFSDLSIEDCIVSIGKETNRMMTELQISPGQTTIYDFL